MARIYKESRYVLQLLIGKSYGAQYDDVKISFYTKNPSNQVMAGDDITIKGNVAEVMVDSTLFDNLEEGLIKYIVYGTKDGIPFIEERQSNYFLKTPLDFKPTTCILEDKSVTPSMGDRDGNNLIVVEESEGYDGLSRVVIDPQTLYNEGVEAGRAEGGSCNLGETEFEFGISDFNDIFELSSSDEGYDGWSKVTIKFFKGDWANIYNAGKIFEDYNNGNSPGVGNYGYVCGKITEIQEVNTSVDNNYASFTLDNCFKVDKCKWAYWDYNRKEQFESEDQIKVDACAVVFGVFQDNNGSLQFEEGTSKIIAYQECAGGSCNLINPIVFSKEAGNTINAENVQIPTFVYEGNQYYNVDSFNLADIEEFKIHILFKPNNRGHEEPINVFGCEDTDWDNTTFGARIYQGQIYFRMSGQDVASPYTENAWYDVEMGYNTTKRWVIVNGETLLETEHTSFNRPRQTLMIGAINSGGNALRPFYGKIAAIYIESNGNQVWLLPKEDGAMYVYWNNRNNRRNSISGDNNARFENDYISGDGMKSITWLGNLEDKWVTPSMSERDDNGYIVVSPSEGYNGLKRTVINPQTLYNEGFEAGRAEGGGGGSCNLGVLDWALTSPNGQQKNASDDGYDGYSQVIVRPENIIAQEKENAINDFKNKMSEITITENGTYSIDDTELTHSISFDGNSYFDTGIVPTENIKIEVCIKVTNGNDSQMGGIIIGGGIDPVNNDTENRGIAIGMGRGAIYGKWGAIKSWNKPYDYVKTTTVVLQKTDDSWQWDTEKGSFGASTLYIGGYNRNGEEVEEKFTQSIVYIKIWTDRNDDSTMTLFRPKNMAQGGFGMVNSEGTEYNYVENLGNGTATFVEENVNKYPNGFKRVEVNVSPKINIQEAGIKLSDSTFTEVPEWADFEGITDMKKMFSACKNLQTIPLIDTRNVTDMGYMFSACKNLQTIPQIDTSNVTNMSFMFASCNSLQTMPLLDTSNVTDMYAMLNACSNLQTIPLLNTSNVTNMNDMFSNCSNLQTIPQIDTRNVKDMGHMFENCYSLQTIPQIDTSNVTDMSYMFYNCPNLQTIPQIDTSNVTNMNYMFSYCTNLQTLPKFNCQKIKNIAMYFCSDTDDMSSLTDVGGWENLSCNWSDNYGLALCPNLTRQSCINILNGLYDFVGNGSTETRTLKVHPNFLTTVGDEISIGTRKGWTIV